MPEPVAARAAAGRVAAAPAVPAATPAEAAPAAAEHPEQAVAVRPGRHRTLRPALVEPAALRMGPPARRDPATVPRVPRGPVTAPRLPRGPVTAPRARR